MYILLLLVASIFIHDVWFFSNAILSSGDWGFFYPENLNLISQFPSTWSSLGLGSVNLRLPTYMMDILWGFFGNMCGFGCAERFIYFYPSLILAIISSYLLCRKITKSSLAATIGALVFSYNTYFVIGRSSHLPLMVAFALAPLIFYFILEIINKPERHHFLLLAITNILISYWEFRAWYIVALSELLAMLFFIFIGKNNFKKNLQISIYILLALASVIVANLYWMISFSAGHSLTSNEFFARALFGDSFLNIVNAFTLFHPFWTGGRSAIFIVQPIPIYFWIIPFIAILSLYVNRKNVVIVFFALISMIGVFLTKQSDIPFTHVYKFLYDHLPGFNAFREGSKFFFYIALGYAVLISSLVAYIFKTNRESSFYKCRYIVTGIIAAIFVINARPLITHEIGTLFVPRHIPNDYLVVKSHLQSHKGFYRSLWIPRESRWTYYDDEHPSMSLAFILPSSYLSSAKDNLSNFILSNNFEEFINISSTRYIFIPLEDSRNDDNFYVYYDSRKKIAKKLDSLAYLKKMNIGTNEVEVYENTHYAPHIFSNQAQVSYTFVKPYEYKVRINNISKDSTLIFSEQFHSEWSLYFGSFNKFDVLTKKYSINSQDYSVDKFFHFNSFVLSPKNLKEHLRNNEYIENPDGSINIEATLYFKPQVYTYIGLSILLTTIGITCACYGVLYLKRK